MTDLNASMMAENMNIMTALYSTSSKIQSVEIPAVLSIHWCTCDINSYKIVFLTPYPVTKLFEFQEGKYCCVYLEGSTLQLYSAYLGSNRPTATDSFVWGLMLMDLVYPDNRRKSQLVSFHYVHR